VPARNIGPWPGGHALDSGAGWHSVTEQGGRAKPAGPVCVTELVARGLGAAWRLPARLPELTGLLCDPSLQFGDPFQGILATGTRGLIHVRIVAAGARGC
jgi:hypothetical protein